MKVTKPKWVHHDGKSIFSLDIHPDGCRFATGGQGKDSGRVSIWNLKPVCDPVYENNENVPKMLCQLDNHLSCVNCVRWSHSGKYLASGGDDKLIMIWKKSGVSKMDDNKVILCIEVWRCVGTLTGHSNDVLDLDWAAHDSWLASCSVDNTIIIWNMDKIPDIVARLTGHTGLVKGVTWDPVGQYLASQSDDKSLRIWRTKDWQQQVCITEPFKECGDMTHVLRLNWAPDGQYLVSAHASNSGGPTAQIIEIIERPIDVKKKTWSCEMDFVGHRKAVTCIKFNSNLLQRMPGADGSKQTKYCTLATGSRDCALAVWCTAKKRPIVVINNLFSKSILDLSWGKDGMQLLACSWDGTVAHLMFNEEELGIIVSEQEKMTTLESLYGKSFTTKHLTQTAVVPIMETPELMELVPPTLTTPNGTKSGAAAVGGASDKPADKISSDSERRSMTDVLQKTKQIENRTVDGKRRVTPILLPRDLVETQGAQTFSSSSEFKTKIIIEQRPEVVHPNVSPAKMKQLGITPSCAPATTTQAGSTSQQVHSVEVTNLQVHNEPVCGKTLKMSSLLPAEVSSKRIASTQKMKEYDYGRCGHRETLMDCLHLGAGTTVKVEGTKDQTVELENPKSSDRPARLKKETNHVLDWETVLSRNVTSLRSNQHVTVATCTDCTLHVLRTDTGCPVTLPVRLPGLASCTTLSPSSQLCVITNRGQLYVWDYRDLANPRLVLTDLTLRQTLLSDCDETSYIVSCKLTEDGTPSVALSSGKCYSYSRSMGWLLLLDMSSVVWKVSQQVDLVKTSLGGGARQDLPLRTLESHVRGACPLNSSKVGVAKQVPAELCTAAFLQQQMNAAMSLNSSLEYKTLLLTLIRYYAQQGLLKPLRATLEDLLGPVHSGGSSWPSTVLGFDKRDLLKEALAAIGPHVLCQRLYTEFNDQLTTIKSEDVPMDL